MTLKTQIQSDIDAVFFNTNDFAFDANYTSKDGSISSKAIKVIPDFNVDLTRTDYGAADICSFLVKKSDIPSPAIYDTLVFETITYTVRQRVLGDNYIWNLVCEADQRQNPRG